MLNTKLSRKKSLTRYNYGVREVMHKGVVTTTAVGTPYFDFFNPLLVNSREFKVGKIPIQYAHRPDLISYAFYNTPGYWWYIMNLNNIYDPFEQLNPRDSLILPKA